VIRYDSEILPSGICALVPDKDLDGLINQNTDSLGPKIRDAIGRKFS
jgi:hypothetical protein